MKRIDITDSVYYGIMDKLSIRPSVKEKIRSSLYANSIWEIRDLCMLTEEEAKSLFFCNETLFSGIKDYLVSVGLHFGMTEGNLIDYMDADFLESLTELSSKQEKVGDEKEDKNSYILIRKKDWEDANAAKNSSSKEAMAKEIKKELYGNIKHFFIFLLIISLPLCFLFFTVRRICKTESPKIESTYSFEKIHSLAPLPAHGER